MATRLLLVLSFVANVVAIRRIGESSLAELAELAEPEMEKAMVACVKVGEKRKDCKHFKAKKHPSVPNAYTCAWKKMCHDRNGKAVAGAGTTGGCGGLHLQARGVCVAVKTGSPEKEELLPSSEADNELDENTDEPLPTVKKSSFEPVEDEDTDEPLPPVKKSSIESEPVQEQDEPMSAEAEEPQDEDTDEPLPPVKSSVETEPVKEETAMAPAKSMTPEEEAAKEGESCRYVTSSWCPPGSRNALAYRKPEGPLCCFKSAKDADEPLPTVKKSSIEPVEDEDTDEPLPPVKKSSIVSEPVQEQDEPMPAEAEEPQDEDMDEPLPPAKKSSLDTEPVKEEQDGPVLAEAETPEEPEDEEEIEDELEPPVKSSIEPEPVEAVEDSAENAAAKLACAKVSKKHCKHFKAKKHPSVPSGYKCAWKMQCRDRRGKVVAMAHSTGACGSNGLTAHGGVCVAVK